MSAPAVEGTILAPFRNRASGRRPGRRRVHPEALPPSRWPRLAAEPGVLDLEISEGMAFEVWGVIAHLIRIPSGSGIRTARRLPRETSTKSTNIQVRIWTKVTGMSPN